jgi:HTH-type transcriptional regulator / antitoxin HigA
MFVSQTEEDYDELVLLLDRLVDEAGGDETHPLASPVDVPGVLIEKCEDEHVPELVGEGGEK